MGCNYPPCPTFNGGLVKPPLNVGHGWVITSHNTYCLCYVTFICLCKLGHRWFFLWIDDRLTLHQHLNQCWFTANETLRNKLQWDILTKMQLHSIRKNAFNDVASLVRTAVCQMMQFPEGNSSHFAKYIFQWCFLDSGCIWICPRGRFQYGWKSYDLISHRIYKMRCWYWHKYHLFL